MVDKEGSRNVSLGPYRSTELALEERLSDEESSDILSRISNQNLYFGKEKDLGSEDIIDLLLKLGHRQEADSLYVKYGIPVKNSGLVDIVIRLIYSVIRSMVLALEGLCRIVMERFVTMKLVLRK